MIDGRERARQRGLGLPAGDDRCRIVESRRRRIAERRLERDDADDLFRVELRGAERATAARGVREQHGGTDLVEQRRDLLRRDDVAAVRRRGRARGPADDRGVRRRRRAAGPERRIGGREPRDQRAVRDADPAAAATRIALRAAVARPVDDVHVPAVGDEVVGPAIASIGRLQPIGACPPPPCIITSGYACLRSAGSMYCTNIALLTLTEPFLPGSVVKPTY